MTDITMIALSKLTESEDNVRKTNRRGGVSELAQSIRSHGLLQSLLVRATDTGRFAVVAGGRRLRALRLLAKAGDIAKNTPIPCRVIEGDNCAELSLAENVVREAMAAVDELDAYRRLIDAGEGPETIAARFGVSPRHVARTLKLARVSPRLIEALKREEATLDQLAALAIVDDHAAQERAFFDAPDWARTPERLKAQVTQEHAPETDKLARFVGTEAYQAEGGAIVSDLFAEDEDTRYLTDRDLLIRLAAAKLEPIAVEVRSEGWAWVEIAIDGVAWSHYPERVRERRRELTAEEAAEQKRLYARLDETCDETEIEAIEAAIDALSASGWNGDEVALAGAVVTLTPDGAPKVERGLVKADDAKALKALRRKLAKDPASGSEDSADNQEDQGVSVTRPSIPAKLMDELMAHKTLALRAEVAARPDLALRLLALALASNALNEFSAFSLVRVRIDEADVSRQITRCESAAPQVLAKHIEAWRERLPSGVDALWAFISNADQQTLLDLVAVLVAPAIELKPGRAEGVVDAICSAASLDMSRYWSATPASYFEHVRRDVIIDAIKDMNPALDRSKLDKASKKEVLDRAKKLFKASSWLPQPLRVHSPTPHTPTLSIAAE